MNHKAIAAGMIFTSLCSSIGLVAFCFVGLVATELVLIPQSARLWAVLVGGAAVAIGAEGGSLFAFVAAFERDGKLRGWDVVGALFSQAATLSTVIFAFRALSGSGSSPVGFVLNTVFVSMDATFNYVALGLHLRNGRALALSEKQASLEYDLQALAIEKQRADLRNRSAPEVLQLRKQVADLTNELNVEIEHSDELRAALQAANTVIDNYDAMSESPGQLPDSDIPANDNGIRIVDRGSNVMRSNDIRVIFDVAGNDNDRQPPDTDTRANDNDVTTTGKHLTLTEWRVIRDTLGNDKPNNAAELNWWLDGNGYAMLPYRKAARWANDKRPANTDN
jgi:hypothetical protein